MSRRPLISVVLPTRNPGPELGRVLKALIGQQDVGPIEVCVVDSGSAARDIAVMRAHGVTLVEIPAGTFSHSHARNIGAERAGGDLLFFTVQDALVPAPTWLRDAAAALDRVDATAVSCREEPRPDADLFARVMSLAHARFLDVGNADVVREAPRDTSPTEWRRAAQLSNVACLVRRDAWASNRFQGDYGEDLDFGLRLLRSGHRLAFLGSLRIVHSHNRPASYHLRRGYVDQRSLQRLLPGYPSTTAEPDAVMRDVQVAYATVDALARQCLGAPGLAREVAALADLTDRTFADARARPSAATNRWQAHEYVDRPCLDLLTDLFRQSRATVATGPYAGALLYTLADVAALAFEFLSNERTLDDYQLEDVRRFLYKAWAFQCGVLLAGGDGHPAIGSGV